MTYELAKKLKDAGFPQEGDYTICSEGIWHILEQGTHYGCKGQYVRYPLLDEIIEACGDRFESLRHGEGLIAGNIVWTANSLPTLQTFHIEAYTPEEAVANLWLELNKK